MEVSTSQTDRILQPPADYFSLARMEVLDMLPKVSSCLELGCGNGATLRAVKALNPSAWLAGIELEPDQAKQVEADQVLVGDVEAMDLSQLKIKQFDAILCLDILEHLKDPWSMTKKLSALLKPGGVLIASLPNVRHHSIVRGLILGRWDYAPKGILDKTHLRFFVKATALQMFRDAGLTPVAINTNCSALLGLVNAITARVFEGVIAYQYLIKSVKGSAAQERTPYWRQITLQAARFSTKSRSKR